MAPERLQGFSRTERALHWVHASAFFVLLGTGLVLYLPRLSELVSRRQLVKEVHLYTGLAWAILIALLLLLGLRHGLRKTIRELERSTPATCAGSFTAADGRAASTPARS
jgi:formate dehydrogenase subunit gamma